MATSSDLPSPTVAAAATLTPTFGQVTGTSWFDAVAVLMTTSG
jgi:hypothetical protein